MIATRTRPFLKWAGGKFRLLPQLVPHLPQRHTFVEPFVGAGAVFLNFTARRFICNDINPDLISLYQQLQEGPEEIIEASRDFFSGRYNNARQYYRLRKKFNKTTCPLERSVLFLYLNRHSYNGLHRINLKGEFNVPFGAYLKPYFPEIELRAFSEKAQSATFSCDSFETCMQKAPRKAVIYCDPPYAPLTETARFTNYARPGFGLEDQARLAEAARLAAQKGCTVIISNHDTPFTRDLYQNADCHYLEVQRLISCKAAKRKRAPEVIAVFD